jgi:hypothetical protein
MRTAIISLTLLALGLADAVVASPIIGTAVERALLAKRTARRRNVDQECYVSPAPTWTLVHPPKSSARYWETGR